jgi:hypothetical protein
LLEIKPVPVVLIVPLAVILILVQVTLGDLMGVLILEETLILDPQIHLDHLSEETMTQAREWVRDQIIAHSQTAEAKT